MKRIIIGSVLVVLVAFGLVTWIASHNKAAAHQSKNYTESTQARKASANQKPLLVVRTDAKGTYYLGKLPVTLNQLESRLVADAATNPQLQLAVNTAKGTPWRRVVSLMDAAKEARIK